jgi:hypothetical protein
LTAQNIVSSVSFADNAKDPIKISYESTCKIASETGDLISTQSCEKIEEGEEYQFNLTIKFDKCPEDPNKWVLKFVKKVIDAHANNDFYFLESKGEN